MVWIQDPVRAEVPEAVATCKRAGITVRMVTGDNIYTAKHIATECGILTEGGLAMEGPEFRALPEDELKAMLPKLQVRVHHAPADGCTACQPPAVNLITAGVRVGAGAIKSCG